MLKNIFALLMVVNFVFSQAVKVYDSPRAQIETPIAINPTNSSNLIGAVIAMTNSSKQIDVCYSYNKGQDWSTKLAISDPGGADPMIAFDPDGKAYLLYQNRAEAAFYLHTSDDGGATWSAKQTVVNFDETVENLDRPWLSVSPNRNTNGKFNIYISYTHIIENTPPESGYSIRILKAVDIDSSFSKIHEFVGYFQGSSIMIGPDDTIDELVLAYADLEETELSSTSIVIRYNYNGSNFGSSHVYQMNKVGNKDNDLKQFVRADSYPRISVDPYRGDFYIVWANKNDVAYSDIQMVKGIKQTDGSIVLSDKGTIIGGI